MTLALEDPRYSIFSINLCVDINDFGIRSIIVSRSKHFSPRITSSAFKWWVRSLGPSFPKTPTSASNMTLALEDSRYSILSINLLVDINDFGIRSRIVSRS